MIWQTLEAKKTVSQIFRVDNLKDILPKLVDTLGVN